MTKGNKSTPWNGGKMFQNYKTKTLKKDILSGIIAALVSIPISMGYAQVAGLPVVYGLYGSLLPILVFSLITSSPQFVFGVDTLRKKRCPHLRQPRSVTVIFRNCHKFPRSTFPGTVLQTLGSDAL